MYCPTITGLKNILNVIEDHLTQLELVVNVGKTKIVIFSKRKYPENTLLFKLNDKNIEIVNEYLYLGSIISGNLSEKSALDRICNKFNKKVGMFFRKFSSVALQVKMQLFDSLCMSLYGLNTIFDLKNCSATFRKLSVSYHYALKRLLGFPKHESNHYTCALLEKMTFQHYMKFEKTKFLFWMRNSKSPCLIGLKNYMTMHSVFVQKVYHFLGHVNIMCAMYLTMKFVLYVQEFFYVQSREESSWHNQ